jgi:prepilin-type N-terminal cleavage/methylation domain-containing protein/prepilin-type processing-associated H-X9-DG protein
MKPIIYEVFQMNTHGCTSPTSPRRKSTLISSGFTLIELLVVIAIIGLLLGILLPGLRKAKQAAEGIVCKAHLKGIGGGLNQYTANWDQWLPGASTSGARTALIGQNDPMSPYQNVDWMSPSLGDNLGLPADPRQRLLDLMNNKLRCPSNRVKNDYIYPSGIPGVKPEDIFYGSYSAIIGFHMYASNGLGPGSENHGLGIRVVTDQEIYGHIRISKSYEPKLTKIGTPSLKVFATEGARYYSATLGVSFNNIIPFQNEGGNFMIQGPVYLRGGDPYLLNRGSLTDPSTWKLTDTAKRLAYRHNDKINMVFFDGHCDTMDLLSSLKPSYYFPRGTLVTAQGALNMQSPIAGEGTIQ